MPAQLRTSLLAFRAKVTTMRGSGGQLTAPATGGKEGALNKLLQEVDNVRTGTGDLAGTGQGEERRGWTGRGAGLASLS